MISNASELLWCRTCGTRLATYIRATTPDRVRLQHGWRRMQAKAVRVDTQHWGGRRDLARQALQAVFDLLVGPAQSDRCTRRLAETVAPHRWPFRRDRSGLVLR